MRLMPITLRELHTKYDLNRTQDKRVTIATRYVADAYHSKESPYPIMNLIQLRQRAKPLKHANLERLVRSLHSPLTIEVR